MKVYTCFLLLRIFAYTHLSEAQSPPTENKRSVNLALETVLEFSNKDHSADIKFLDNVQSFITKVKTVIDKNANKNARRIFKAPKMDSLTDFIVEVVNLVDQFDDTTFQEFYEILDEEIRKYHYRGCKFYELTENIEIRKLLADKLNLIKGKSIFVIRTYVNSLTDIIKTQSYDKYVKELVDYINSLYRQDAKDKFKEILGEIEFYSKNMKSKKTNANFVKVIRNAIRSAIFDHYTKLAPNARRALKDKIDSFWKQYKHNSSTTPKSDHFLDVDHDSYGKIDKSNFSTHDRDLNKASTPDVNKKDNDQNVKRFEIMKSDFKKKIMRDGVKDKNIERVKYPKIDTGYEDANHSIEYHSENLSERSSAEIDLTGETLERNSIELYQKHQEEINTQRYMTLYPEAITNHEQNTEEPEKVIHRSAKIITARPIGLQTMWIEEATGTIPKFLIKKYNQISKKKHDKNTPKSVSHEKKRWSKKESKRKAIHGTKHIKRKGFRQELKQKRKHNPKQKTKRHGHSKNKSVSKNKSKLMPKHKRANLFSQDRAFIDMGTAMELYEYKKMMAPGRIKKKSDTRTISKMSTPMRPAIPSRISVTKRSTVSPRFSVVTRPSVPPRPRVPSRLLIPSQNHPTMVTSLDISVNWMVSAPLEKYSKRYEILTGKQHKDFRKNASISPRDNFNLDKRRKTARRQSFSNTSDKFDVNVDLNVIKRINELEKELNEVKSKMKDMKSEETKLKKISDRLLANDKMENSKKFNVGLGKGSLRKDLNIKNDKEIDYKTEFKFIKEKDKPLEEVKVIFPVTKREVAETKNMKVTKLLETNRQGETKTDDVINKRLNSLTDSKGKLVTGDRRGKFGFEDWASDGRNEDVSNYDQEDAWKNPFKFYMKPSTRSTTTKATKSTSRPENTTTIQSTKLETIPSMVELFISVPSLAPSTKKPAIIMKETKTYVPTVDVENENKTAKYQSEFNEPIKNITIEDSKNEIIMNNNITMTTLSTVNDGNDTRILSAVNIKNRKEVLYSPQPIWFSKANSTTNEFLYTDPFEGIDHGIEIPFKK